VLVDPIVRSHGEGEVRFPMVRLLYVGKIIF